MGGGQSLEESTAPSTDHDEGETPSLYERARIEPHQWPIVYSGNYNIGFMGIQKLHPFDSGKWGKIFNFLQGMYNILAYGLVECHGTSRRNVEPCQ